MEHLLDGAPAQAPASTSTQRETVHAFERARESRDIEALLHLLDPHVTVIADSGGLAPAAPGPLEGADRVAHHDVTIAERSPADASVVECVVNARPGLAVQQGRRTVTVLAFDIADGRIRRLGAVRNPEKLRTRDGR